MSAEQQAQLLEEIAAVMRERPEDWWLEFERRWHAPDCVGAWIPARGSGQVWIALHDSEWEVRRRPRTITISGEISAETAKAVREMHATMVKGSHPERLFRELAALIGTSGGEVE